MASQDFGQAFSATATHATLAVATQAAVTASTHYVTDISGSSDKAGARIVVKDGSTVIWQDRVSNTTPYEHSFVIPLRVSTSAAVSVTVDGTAEANANIAGYSI